MIFPFSDLETFTFESKLSTSPLSPEPAFLYFLIGNYILGASFFRSRTHALKYIGSIVDVAKYVEDNTSAAFALADGIRFHYYNDYVVWYEFGAGVSSSRNKEWEKILEVDFVNSYKKLVAELGDKNIVNTLLNMKMLDNKVKKIWYLLFNDPRIFFKILFFRFLRSKKAHRESYDLDILKTYLCIGEY